MGAYIKENWLFVVVAVYLVSMVLYGHYRGFVRLAVSAVSLVLSLGASFLCLLFQNLPLLRNLFHHQ